MGDFPTDYTGLGWVSNWEEGTTKRLLGSTVFYGAIVVLACTILGLLGLLFTRVCAGISAKKELAPVPLHPQVSHNDRCTSSPNLEKHEKPKQASPLLITPEKELTIPDEIVQTFSTIDIETPLGLRTYIKPNQSELLTVAGKLFIGAGYSGFGKIPCLQHVDTDRNEVVIFDLILCTRHEKKSQPPPWYHRIPLLGMRDNDGLEMVVSEDTRQLQLDRGLQAKKELEDSGWPERMGYAKIDFATSGDLQEKYGMQPKYTQNIDAIVCVFRAWD